MSECECLICGENYVKDDMFYDDTCDDCAREEGLYLPSVLNIDIDFEKKIRKVASRYGIEVKKVKDKDQAGFYVVDKDGSSRKIDLVDVFKDCL